jgi:hypothetical protein
VKVTYGDSPPQIDAVKVVRDALLRKTPSWIPAMYCTKPADWSYEQEWRVIHSKRGTAYCYEKETLKALYFGPRCSRHFIETVCLILQGQNRGVTFWCGETSHTKYAVEFKQFTYTSAADAPPT